MKIRIPRSLMKKAYEIGYMDYWIEYDEYRKSWRWYWTSMNRGYVSIYEYKYDGNCYKHLINKLVESGHKPLFKLLT